MCVKCLYSKVSWLPPCLTLQYFRWWNLKNFLENKKSKPVYQSIIPDLKCIKIKDDRIEINSEKCIWCMFCFSNCSWNLVHVNSDYWLTEKCDTHSIEKQLEDIDTSGFFNWSIVETRKVWWIWKDQWYNSLENFTWVNETKNISIRWASIIKYLAWEDNPRLWLELNMTIKSRDRWWRLDISLLNNNNDLFCFEAKVWFKKLMQEWRYISQMIAYRKEVDKIKKEISFDNWEYFQYLLVWDNETDLLYSDHVACTSKIWGQSEKFYESLVEYDLFFISANALRALSLKKIVNSKKYNLENVFKKISHQESYWLLTAWVVCKWDDWFYIRDLDSFL